MLFLIGVIMCATSGYGIYENLEDKCMQNICNNKIPLKNIVKAEKKLKEHNLEGKLYYYYDKHTMEFWAEYSVKLPKEKTDKDIINIKLEFYKIDGEHITKDQLIDIYNMIIKKYQQEDATERKLSKFDFMELTKEKILVHN